MTMITPAAPARTLWTVAATAIGGLAAIAVAVRGINHDSAWYVHLVEVWLAGGVPYVDAVDTNPPLIVLLTVPPVWAAHLVGASATVAFQIYVYGLAALSTLACARLAREVWPEFSATSRAAIATGIAFLLLAFPKADFGQREHLAVVLTLPYVVATMLVPGSRFRVPGAWFLVLGFVGGLGFALKPHFLLAWLAVESVVAIQRRTLTTLWRREAVAAIAAFVAYAAVSAVLFPQYFAVAEAVWQVYGGLDSPTLRLVQLREIQAAGIAVAILALIRLGKPFDAPLAVIGAAMLGLLGASLLQLKGWGYQMLPAQSYLALLFLVALVSVLEATPALAATIRGGARGVGIALIAALVLTGVKYAYEAREARRASLVTPLTELVRAEAPDGPLAVLSMRTLVYPAFPLVNKTGALWSLRHHSLWFLPGLYVRELTGPTAEVPFRPIASMPPLEREFYEEILIDLCRTPPALLFIEPAPHFAPAGRRALDLVAYYSQDDRFRSLFSHYQRLQDVTPFMVYRSRDRATCRATPQHAG